MLAATVLMLAVTVFLMKENEALVFQNNGRLVVKEIPGDPGAVSFIWRSEVEPPMARRFAESFDEWKDRSDRIVIDLNSPGGAVREGEAVIAEIERMKRTHVVDTRIGPRRACYSMCVPIFLQGERRVAAANARFMFHEPTARDYFTGEEARQPAFEKRYVTNRFVERYFVNSPMDEGWREKLVAEWEGRDVFKSAKKLVDEGSNVVTDLE